MGASLDTQLKRAEKRAKIAELEARAAAANRVRDAANGSRRSGPVAASGSFKKVRGRLNSSTRAQPGSSDFHRDADTRERMARECRDVLRNNPLAQMLVSRRIQMLMGEGPRFSSECPDRGWARKAERLMDEWANGTGSQAVSDGGPGAASVCGRFTVTDLISQAAYAAHSDGRMGLLMVLDRDPARPGGGRPALQAIEDERITNPGVGIDGQRERDKGGRWVNGVLLDDRGGRPLAYGVSDYDDRGGFVQRGTHRLVSPRHMLHLAAPGARGVNTTAPEPLLYPIANLLEQWDEAVDATVVCYRVATFFGAVFTGAPANASAQQLGMTAGIDTTDPNSARAADASVASEDGSGTRVPLEPGEAMHLGVDGNVTQLRPEHPVTGLDALDKMLLGKMAAALDMSVDAVAFDYDGNWSASRSRLTMMWRAMSPWRRWLLEALHRIARWRLRWAILTGELPEVDGWDEMSWTIAAMPLLDPEKEIKWARDGMDALLLPPQTVLSNMGLPDVEHTAAQFRLARDVYEANGLDPAPRQGAPETQRTRADDAGRDDPDQGETDTPERDGDDPAQAQSPRRSPSPAGGGQACTS